MTLVPPRISTSAAVRALPGNTVEFPVLGSLPIYTAIMSDSTVLVNTTSTATVRFFEEGNYTCVAISRAGSDLLEFSVIFINQPGNVLLTF